MNKNKELFEVNFEEIEKENKKSKNFKNTCEIPKISQEQLYDMLTSRELSWQSIIFDLIKTEQLNPMDIDIVLLTRKYLETIQKMEELGEMSFFISSKLLYAASLLLRIKSAYLRNNLRDIDEILFDKKKKMDLEDLNLNKLVEWDEEDLPLITPKTPMPRQRKVTLQELINALNNAMETEQRRIKKQISWRRAQTEIDMAVFPNQNIKLDLKDRLKRLYEKISGFFFRKKDSEEENKKLTFSMISGNSKEEKINNFIPLLHLDHQKKIWLEQEKAFQEIEILLQERYDEIKKLQNMEMLKEENEDIKEK